MWQPTVNVVAVAVYDDTASVFPTASITTKDGTRTAIYDELVKCNPGLVKRHAGSFIIKRQLWDAIIAWADAGRFGEMDLHEYLNRMFGARV